MAHKHSFSSIPLFRTTEVYLRRYKGARAPGTIFCGAYIKKDNFLPKTHVIFFVTQLKYRDVSKGACAPGRQI